MMAGERWLYNRCIDNDVPDGIATQNIWFAEAGIQRPSEKYVKPFLSVIKKTTSNPRIKNYINISAVRTWGNTKAKEYVLRRIKENKEEEPYGRTH